MRRLVPALLVATVLAGCSTPDPNLFDIETPQGTITVRLYDETPGHRDNFAKLANDGYYDGTLFHRVVEGFMIQGGDPISVHEDSSMYYGTGGPGYRVDAEFVPELFHKKGALAAARDGNPAMASSGSQFYIVQGQVYTDSDLDQMATMMSRQTGVETTIDGPRREAYPPIGGVPWLDGQYTVFGEVVEGLEVLDAIAAVDTPGKTGQATSPQLAAQPLERVPMNVRPHR